MKMMIASDIHGSAYYCEKMIKAYQMEKADKLLLLGDILYHGPRNDLPKEYQPKKVISLLNDIKQELVCVRGNCEAEVDQMVLDFPVLADYCVFYVEGHMIYATHGHHLDDKTYAILKPNDILLCGHTHIPLCEKREHFIYCNPGSVSIPKENSPHGYMLLENSELIWKDFEGKVYQQFMIS